MLTPSEKSPLSDAQRGDRTCIMQNSKLNTLPTEVFWPKVHVKALECPTHTPRTKGQSIHQLTDIGVTEYPP